MLSSPCIIYSEIAITPPRPFFARLPTFCDSQECPGLMDRTLSLTEVDLIFVKTKAKQARRVGYGQVRG